MNESTYISKISLGVYSPEDIIKNSVCEIKYHDLKIGTGTLYDERMGPVEVSMDVNKRCITCDMSFLDCPGHFGHINLNEVILHPLLKKYVVNYLRCFCKECSGCIFSKDQLKLKGIFKFDRKERENEIRGMDIADGQKHMLIRNMEIEDEHQLEKIMALFKPNMLCPHCNSETPQPSYSLSKERKCIVSKTNLGKKVKETIELTASMIKKIFDNISNESIRTLGLDPTRIHPKNLIISVLLVIAPSARPCVKNKGEICDDDLTVLYADIVKINEKLNNKGLTLVERGLLVNLLKFRIKSLMDNDNKKDTRNNGQPRKGVKERLKGKEGLIRGKIMGKRVDGSGRTVAGPDPTLKVDEIAIPPEFAEILTFPVKVTKFNQKSLTDLVNRGEAKNVITNKNGRKINRRVKYALASKGTKIKPGDMIARDGVFLKINDRGYVTTDDKDKISRNATVSVSSLPLGPGDIITREGVIFIISENFLPIVKEGDIVIRNDEKIEVIAPGRLAISLNVGDIVKRKLREGDVLLLNRQPTLHIGSMIAVKIKIREGKTIRTSLAITKSLNLDYDGDELNVHTAVTMQSVVELLLLASVDSIFVSSQSSKCNITIVQDALLASYLMTSGWNIMDKKDFFNISMNGDGWTPQFILDRIEHNKEVFKELKVYQQGYEYSGRSLFSMVLPLDFIYNYKTKAMKDEPILKIYKGVIYEGAINKVTLKGGHDSLNKLIFKEYGSSMAKDFINNVQFIAYPWISRTGFSVGLDDCMTTDSQVIQSSITKNLMQAKNIQELTKDPAIREIKVSHILNKAKDMGMKLAKDSFTPDNSFVAMVEAGSKGDYFNIAQITGLLGQQNLGGKRIPPKLNGCRRTLPHYPFHGITIKEEFESRGFIHNSFTHGLNPQEYFLHSMAGREGITDTGTKTYKSGYCQRKINKVMEETKVHYDGTVRNGNSQIIQFAYGDDGYNGSQTIFKKGIPQVCDISRLVDQLNLQHEMNI